MQKLKNRAGVVFAIVAVLYCLLLIPDREQHPVMAPAEKPFEWNMDSLWKQRELDFSRAKNTDTAVTSQSIGMLLSRQQSLLQQLASRTITPGDSLLPQILTTYFEMASSVAAVPAWNKSFLEQYNIARREIKKQSIHWDVRDKKVRDILYRLLYGMRIATEEVLLQSGTLQFDPVLQVTDEPSATPSASLFGITVHSGDLLLSRGGAEVSALISRGNNYPGNFSHVALLYVEEKTNTPYLIEAHIEKGVAVSSAKQYMEDKKMRFMVLRPQAGLAALKQDPLLPHKAAMNAYKEALSHHIPYDFKMNFNDSTAMFCSEVGSSAYKKMGVLLWQAPSAIASAGVMKWLGDFGVENFITQMPADLEYDPQLSVVAEWRNPETLRKDHVDNAVMDALLWQADRGREIGYNTWQLPLVRVLKGWCIIKNSFGGVGMIPEGMSATRALKNNSFVQLYQQVKTKTLAGIDAFVKKEKYYPPYWQLVAIAKEACGN